MKSSIPPRLSSPTAEAAATAPSRRHLLVGLGAAGAAGVAVTALPLVKTAVPAAAPEALAAAPEAGGGYQLTQHVLRYYQTAKV
jgi:hypothetical protein